MERSSSEQGPTTRAGREVDLEQRLDHEDELWGDRELAALRRDLALTPADDLRFAS